MAKAKMALAVHAFSLRLGGVFRGTPPGRRRVRAGEVARQRGHDGDAEDGEGSGDDEGSQVVARDVFEEPWRGAGRLVSRLPRWAWREATKYAGKFIFVMQRKAEVLRNFFSGATLD